MIDRCLSKYCVGCGLCISQKKATISTDAKGFYHPDTGDETWLKKVCPAYGAQQRFISEGEVWGKNKGVYYGYSSDVEIRRRASSGGVLTGLSIWLLENGWVDAIIHTCALEDEPTRTRICYSTCRDEVIARSGSRYSISHPLQEMHLLERNKKYAFIGKPCDVSALRNYMQLDPSLKTCIPYILSFFCMGLPSVDAQKKLLKALGCPEEGCKQLVYRGDGWPGFTIAKDKDDREYQMDYDSSWGKILGRDLMPACRFCLDGIGEVADISCGDAWYADQNGNPDFSEREGRNAVFVRTFQGEELLKRAAEDGAIILNSFEHYKSELAMMQKAQFERRASMRSRILALRLFRRESPKYSGRLLKTFEKEISLKHRIQVFASTCKRILKGTI